MLGGPGFGPGSVASDAAGDVYFALENMVYRLDLSGTLTRVAGNGSQGFSGDNGPALSAHLWSPSGVALDALGNLYIADTENLRVRRVSADGTITTVAGGGPYGDLGDNGPATSAFILEPLGLAVDAAGGLRNLEGRRHICIVTLLMQTRNFGRIPGYLV